MNADGLAQALACGRTGCKCGRKSGASWTSHCPAHDDRHPSLSLSNGDNRVLFACHAGCAPDAVIEVLKARGLWPSPTARNGRKAKPRETRYEVRDVGGELAAVHVRRDLSNDSKAMHWTRPDGSLGLGGLPVSALPLYGSERLPALPNGARAVLTEGEKAADALSARGIPAAATVTGAPSTPGDDALSPLVRLSVALWPDADAVGREHMRRIGAVLLRLGCADVRLMDWPDAPDKGDAADFDGTDAELMALLDGAQPIGVTPTPDGAEVLENVCAFIRRYVVTGGAEADTLTLWTAHSHAIEAAEATPYINLTSAEKRSGKTRTLEALTLLTAKPWLTSRTSPAVLVRKLDRDGPTLLLDETDAAFKDGGDYAEALRAVLNAGHRRGGVASLCVKAGGDFELRDFAVFGPKSFAGIGQHLPETVRDRSITIELRRRAPGESVERFRRREAEVVAASIREALERWTAAHLDTLRAARPDIPEALDDRAADGWESLLAIADAAGGEWPTRARRAALVLSAGESREDDSLGVRLLRDVRAVFEKRGADRLTSAEIVALLVADESAPWGDLRGKAMDARALARLLRRYNIRPHVMRLQDATPRGYNRADFEDCWRRYTAPEQAQQAQQAQQAPDTDTGNVADVADVAANPGMGEHAPDALPDDGRREYVLQLGAELAFPAIPGHIPAGRERWEGVARYFRSTDLDVVIRAVEAFMPDDGAERPAGEWRLCCDDDADPRAALLVKAAAQ